MTGTATDVARPAALVRPSRAALLLAGLAAVMLLAPLFVGGYMRTVLILFCLQAYLGLSWNVMMGFAGQLSLGHALYVGLGAYAAGALFVHFGVPPWIGALAGIAVAAAAGAVVGTLGFRFRVKGVYFALLTIAFAEFTRILFDHWGWIGASSGMFLPVAHGEESLLYLRGGPLMFYYVVLGMLIGGFLLCWALLRRRIGYYWQAIREDQDAAETLGIDIFKYKMAAVMLSAAMTAVGGMFYAFYYNNLYPETIFAMHRSIELIMGTIIGGVGTLFGPILGAALLVGLGELLSLLTEDWGLDGIKQMFYGACLLAIILWRPSGLWPWLRDKLNLGSEP